MSESETAGVRVDDDAAVRTITINRPEKKNAFTLAMYEAMTAALVGAATDDGVRAVVLAGAGGSFTAGNDLSDFLNSPPTGEDSAVFRFLLAIAAFEKPLLAAVDGPAIGIGTTMLLHCDLVYASERARFQLPFVTLGLCPEGASSVLLAARVGLARANEWLFLGEPIDAASALAAGLVNGVVAAEKLAAHVAERAKLVASKPPGAVAASKRLLREPQAAATRAALSREGAVFTERIASSEAHAALTAFFTRKKG